LVTSLHFSLFHITCHVIQLKHSYISSITPKIVKYVIWSLHLTFHHFISHLTLSRPQALNYPLLSQPLDTLNGCALGKYQLHPILRLCPENLIDVYGIGVGRYPVGTFAIFAKCVWSLNSRYLVTAVSGFFGNEMRQTGKKIDFVAPVVANADRPEAIFKKIGEKWEDICCYKDMFRELRDYILCHESIIEFLFEEGGLDGGGAINPAFVPEKSMYRANTFAGQKILVCCFWSKVVAGPKESDRVDPRLLTQHFPGSQDCVQDVLSHYGIKFDVVQNSKDRMLKMRTGQYYAVWVICGAGTGKVPDGGNPYLIDQFIRGIHVFWRSGGALVWWCDNDPLTFECNE
jgi:hypothetical protein